MRTYLTIFSAGFKERKRSWTQLIITALLFFVIVFVYRQLWGYIYGNGIKSLNGFSMESMVWYLIFSEVIYFCSSNSIVVKNMNNDIKSGKIGVLLNKPYNYYLYSIFSNFGSFVFEALLIVPFGLITAFVLCKMPMEASIIGILLSIGSMFLSIFLTLCFTSIIGLLGFWFEDSIPFWWIVSKTFLLFGVIFPPTFFPKAIGLAVTYSPLYAMFSGPATMFSNFSWKTCAITFGLQVGYILLFMLIGLAIFKIAKKKVSVNGG